MTMACRYVPIRQTDSTVSMTGRRVSYFCRSFAVVVASLAIITHWSFPCEQPSSYVAVIVVMYIRAGHGLAVWRSTVTTSNQDGDANERDLVTESSVESPGAKQHQHFDGVLCRSRPFLSLYTARIRLWTAVIVAHRTGCSTTCRVTTTADDACEQRWRMISLFNGLTDGRTTYARRYERRTYDRMRASVD